MKNYNKYYTPIVCITILSIMITAFTRIYANAQLTYPANITITQIESTNPTQSTTQIEEKRFIITEQSGKLVVYVDGESKPFKITDTLINDLPEYDRDKIKLGIIVYGDIALQKALEDYCS